MFVFNSSLVYCLFFLHGILPRICFDILSDICLPFCIHVLGLLTLFLVYIQRFHVALFSDILFGNGKPSNIPTVASRVRGMVNTTKPNKPKCQVRQQTTRVSTI